MKIMIQNRGMIMTMPRNIWIAIEGESQNGIVLCGSNRAPVLGLYESADRAKEILAEIFEFERCGKANYIMPEK